MSPEELFQFLAHKPFQPVRVHVADGRVYDIRFRELAIVGETWLDIGIPAPGETEPIYDHVVHVPLQDIRRVERLTTIATPIFG